MPFQHIVYQCRCPGKYRLNYSMKTMTSDWRAGQWEVLWLFFCCCDQLHDQQPPGGGEVCVLSSHSPSLLCPSRREAAAGAQGRKRQAAAGAETTGVMPMGLLTMASSVCLLRQPKTTCPGVVPSAVSWALPHQSLTEKMSTDLSTGQPEESNSSTEFPSWFKMTWNH